MDDEQLDAAWDFGDPAGSEQRLRALLETTPPGPDADVVRTQVARALGLQEQYAEGHTLLDAVRAADDGGEAEVRERLERGRLLRSAGTPDPEPFEDAAAMAAERGYEALHVDALHMLALLVSDPEQQISVTEAALAVADAASEPRARAWRASLLTNLGMARHDAGDLDGALREFRSALALREEAGTVADVRVARWMVAWTLRLQGHTAEALAMQEALAADLASTGDHDPYVDEELALLRPEA